MSAPRFYVGTDDGRVPAAGCEGMLPDAAAHHALRVLRMAVGDAITLFDGHGGEAHGTLVHADRRDARVRIDALAPLERELALPVTLALAVIATDPMDSAVRKAVELGVTTLVPLQYARSQGVLRGEKAARRLAHWQQIAVAACEQCGRNRVPQVAPVLAFADWCATAGPDAVMLAPGAPHSLATWLAAALPRASVVHGGIALAVGPEGGYTDVELALADSAGITRAAMGTRVLRAETAAIAAVAIIATTVGDAG